MALTLEELKSFYNGKKVLGTSSISRSRLT